MLKPQPLILGTGTAIWQLTEPDSENISIFKFSLKYFILQRSFRFDFLRPRWFHFLPRQHSRDLCYNCVTLFAPKSCGLHYKHYVIVTWWSSLVTPDLYLFHSLALITNYTSRVGLQIVASLSEDSRGIIYNHKMFVVQAHVLFNFLWL